MNRMLKAVVAMAMVASLTGWSGAASASTGTRDRIQTTRLAAALGGGNEVPGPGDPDGGGFIEMQLRHRPSGWRLCYQGRVVGLDGVTMGHIHSGGAGVKGPVVVDLMPILKGHLRLAGCIREGDNLTAAEAEAIAANPGGFYANVHNATFPDGAARGQLNLD